MRPSVVKPRSKTFGNIIMMLAWLSIAAVLLIICSGCVGSSAEPAGVSDKIMSDTSHSSDADPDYSVVFPDDQVNTLTMTISSEEWQTMLDNMTELYGEFGTDSSQSAAGNRGGGMGGMSSSIDPVYVPADISFNGEEWTDVGLRFKGQMSLGSSWREGSYKISFKLNFDKFEDENPDIKNQRFYGFDELNLQSCYGDDSLMRDMVVPTIFRESGVPAPYTAFYRIYVDYGEGPVYFGLYTMVETVEDTVIETQFEDDSGNVYKPEGTGATFAEGTFEAASFEKKTNEDEADWSDVEALYAVLNSDTRTTDPEQWRDELEAVFDVDVFLRWLATNTVIQNWDTYGGNCRNFYLYTDPNDGLITWIPWDNNFALAGSMNNGGQIRDFPAEMPADVAFMPPDGFAGDRDLPEDFVPPAERAAGGAFPGEMNADIAAGMIPGARVPGEMNADMAAGMNRGGGMGSPLSLDLDEAGENWPLIRYLADDPVYYETYLDYLELVATTSFEPTEMEETFEYYHDLIEPYVTGSEGEQTGYTHLKSAGAFDDALEELIGHTYSRYDTVMEFLATEGV